MRVRGISSNTLINVDNGGGNIKSGLAPSTGYMRRSDKSLLFRMKSHRKKKTVLINLTENEKTEFMERVKAEFTELKEQYKNDITKTDEDLKKLAINKVRKEFETIGINDEDVEISTVNNEPEIKPNRDLKRIARKLVPIN